ncbi:alpha/beta hydrolase family protein [Alkalimarinus sediminis]|uniref:Alpha/beta hydrolase n=1 Tax=Alkalimarinus sediminis TaxID=1632866 RepID=A0A9E8HKG9_9ALTE|nr:hypothetical protein [Alkalimarinus sediminis]UZW76305.1 hypothetical protein NNL22_06895 [Alkalimarinus sediminis]
MLNSVWQATQILWSLHTQPEEASCDQLSQERCDSYDITVKGQAISVDHYEEDNDYSGTLVVIHGMSPKGKRDPRVVQLCYALGKVGFRVISPEIVSISQLTICPSQIQSIADVMHVIARDQTITPSGKIGVLAPSFSGAMCLSAASLPELKSHISAVCAIGTFTDVVSVISYLLNDTNADPYGRFIVLKKIVPLVCEAEKQPLLLGALEAAIRDNLNEVAFDAPDNEYHRYLGNAPYEAQQHIHRLFNDLTYRDQLLTEGKVKLAEEIKALNILQHIHGLTANVFLLHGASDIVIPCNQSERLYRELKELKIQSNLVVTPFISHGDTRFHFHQIRDVAKIIQGFAGYFKSVANFAA